MNKSIATRINIYSEIRRWLFLTAAALPAMAGAQTADAHQIIDKVDANMSADTRIMTSQMEVNSARATRTMEMKTWTIGDEKAFTEYLSPARERGTKMLKLDNQLWIYSPSTDRTIQISGHMLLQSVMGSDLPYEDMMNDKPLLEQYNAAIAGEEMVDGRNCWVIDLTAKITDINYYSQKIWVDQERYVMLKAQQFAKSGKMLKEITLSNVRKVQRQGNPVDDPGDTARWSNPRTYFQQSQSAMNSFGAIDFETANEQRTSVCNLGGIIVRL